tara:strand:- start:924 stop:1190 length:267 start_codon:yes stop_codon:yes gene_type:complete
MIFMATLSQVSSYLKALFWSIFDELATKEQASQRWRICRLCAEYDPEEKICMECGCGVNPHVSGARKYAQKVFFKSEACPLGKWDKLK